MKQIKQVKLGLAILSVFATCGSLVVPSHAAGVDGADTRADRLGYVIVNEATGQQVGGATFYPTGPLAPDTLVVVAEADGSLPGGITESQLKDMVAQRRAEAAQATSMEVNTGNVGTDPGPLRVSGVQWSAPLGCGYGPVAQWSPAIAGYQGVRMT
ncbi:MAG: hypothetical protein FWD75_00470 [Propionibacteriaceae bacterium]|nr:hypothetical protein [Propionibacteriaceae bacterium]